MNKLSIFLKVILIQLVAALVANPRPWPRGVICPARCVCTITNAYLYPLRIGFYHKVDCAGKELNFIPKNLPLQTDILLLNNNRIRSIAQSSFRSILDLRYLDLSYNNLQFVQDGVFDFNRNVHLINLGWNSIQALDDSVFRRQEELTDLTLAGNILTEVPYAVQNIRSLQVLQLYQNSIIALEGNPFLGLESLQFLNLHDNQIEKIEYTVFLRNLELSNIYLNANKIRALPPNLFRNLRNLDYLALSDNLITGLQVMVFRLAGNIRSLDLQRNRLTTLPNGIFLGMARLREINLQENMLRTMPSSTFQGLNNLRSIDLSKNTDIGTLPPNVFSHLPNLETIVLSHLTGILPTTFYGLPHLKTLKITQSNVNMLQNTVFKDNRLLEQLALPNCGIITVEQRALAGLSKLRTIDLSDNRLTYIDERMFAQSQLNLLETLHLQYNEIRDVSVGAFRNLATLTNLRLDNNEIEMLKTSMFGGLVSLTSLEVDHNVITLVQAAALDGMPALKRFDISNNPINCDCTILPFIDWFRMNQNKIFSLTQTVCGAPSIYAHYPITTVMNTVAGSPFTCIPPTITSQPKAPEIYIKVRTHSKLPCDLNERVVAQQEWTLPGNRRIFVRKTPTTAFSITQQKIYALADGTLIIKDADYTDSGTYTCTATNDQGIVSITYNILVVDSIPAGGVTAPGAGGTGGVTIPGAGNPNGPNVGVGNPGAGIPTGNPGVGNPGTGNTNTGTGNPGIGNPGIGNPGIGNPGIGNPGIGNPGIGNPGIGNPGIGNPGIGNPGIGNPGIGNPGIGNPGIGNPGIGNPGNGNPGIGNPGIRNPGNGNPGIGNPGIGNPGIGNPGIGNPGNGNPGIGNPGIGNPGNGNPGIGNPGIGNPDIGNPGIGNPGIGNPGTGNPGIGNPGIGNPGIGNPGIGYPGIGNPGFGNPGIGNPGIGNPGIWNPGTGTAGSPGGIIPGRGPAILPTNFPSYTTEVVYDPHPCTPSPCLHKGKCTEVPADEDFHERNMTPKVTSKAVPVAVAEPVVLMAQCTCAEMWGGRYCEILLPGRPTNVEISNTHSNFIQIKWQEGEVNGELSGYKVLYRKIDGGTDPIEVSMPLDPDVKSFTLHQLDTEATYRICVVAYNTGGESGLSEGNCIMAHTNESDKTHAQDNMSILIVSLGGLGLLVAIAASVAYYRYNHRKNKPAETIQQRAENLKKGLQKKGRAAVRPARAVVRPETVYYSHNNDNVLLLEMNPQIPSMMYLNPSAAPQKAIKPKPQKRFLQIQTDLE